MTTRPRELSPIDPSEEARALGTMRCLGATGVEILTRENVRPEVSAVPAGTHLGRQGSVHTGLFAVLDGLVRLYRVSDNGREQVIRLIGDGECFCLCPPIAATASPFSAECLVDTRYAHLDAEMWRSLFWARLTPNLRIAGCLVTERAGLVQLAEDLSSRSVEHLLRSYLGYLAKRRGRKVLRGLLIEDGVSRRQLAAAAGSVPEVVSRVLAQLEEQKILERRHSGILVLDPERIGPPARAPLACR